MICQCKDRYSGVLVFSYKGLAKAGGSSKDGGINTWKCAGVARYGIKIIKGRKERGAGWQKEGAAPKIGRGTHPMVLKHWANSQREKVAGTKMNTDIIHSVLESLMIIGEGV